MLSVQPVLVIIFRKILGEFHCSPVHGQVRHYAALKVWRKLALPLTSVWTNDHVKDRVPSYSLGPFTGTFLDRATINFFTVPSSNSSSCYRTPLKFMLWILCQNRASIDGPIQYFLATSHLSLAEFFSSRVEKKAYVYFSPSQSPPPHTHVQNQKTKL